jgi:tripartite-type tricarboxylate transporter receptor subunit TctC
LFGNRTGIKMTHVPYKGTAPAMNDLMGGHIDFLLGSISAMVPVLNSGKVRPLTVTATSRSDAAKSVPSYTEFGLKDMTMTSWVVIMAPAGTPQAVIDTLNAAINKTVDSPDVIKSLMQDGVMPQTGTPAMAAAFIKKETEQWRAIAKQVGMVPGGF